jgi:2-oxoglutarate ferredoxin oxidoreductase subunit alpha
MKTPVLLLRQVLHQTDGVVFQKKFLQGNEAIVEAVIAAGVSFYAGYPITPSTEIAELLSVKLPRLHGKFIQMEDEIASMGAIIGASLAGSKSMTATSGPGFSLKQELIGYAGMAQVPCFIVDVMRAGPSTGLPTASSQGDVQQAVWGTHGDHPVVVAVPASVAEMYYLSIWCVNVSEQLRIPAILLPDEIIGHMRESVPVPPAEVVRIIERIKPSGPPEQYIPFHVNGIAVQPMAEVGGLYRHNTTGLVYDEEGFPSNSPERAEKLVSYLLDKVLLRREELVLYDHDIPDNPELVIIAYGSTARSAEFVVAHFREKGVAIGLFRPITIHPFPSKEIAGLASVCDRFILAEANRGQLTAEVSAALGGNAELRCIHQSDGMIIPPSKFIKTIEQWGVGAGRKGF